MGVASISPDYYTRLEQGRRQASEPVLDTLARVLRLDDGERAYMFELSGRDAARPRRRTTQKVQPQLRRLLDDLSTTPAVVLGRRTDILAWNPMAAALFTDFARIPEKKRNFVRLVFCDPAVRALYPDWDWVAQTSLAQLRMQAARDPTRIHGWRNWWASCHFRTPTSGGGGVPIASRSRARARRSCTIRSSAGSPWTGPSSPAPPIPTSSSSP